MPHPIKSWKLVKKPPVSPRVFFQHLAIFTGALLLGAVGLLLLGKPIAAAACLANALLAVAFAMFFAVHVADGDEILLYADELVVHSYRGLRYRRWVLPLATLVIEAGHGRCKGCYWLRHGPDRVPVGEQLDVIPRCLLVSEIAQAVLACRAA